MDAGLSVDDQTRGLDWVHWLLRSVRQRCPSVVMQRIEDRVTAQSQWRKFVRERFLPELGELLLRAWSQAEARDVAGLMECETRLASILNEEESERSILAGRLLLECTQGALYQGVLGHFRTAVEEERAAGHIGIIWPALAAMFQLTPAAMLAEYLRLEWDTTTRELVGVAAPLGSCAITKVASETLMRRQGEPRVLRRRKQA